MLTYFAQASVTNLPALLFDSAALRPAVVNVATITSGGDERHNKARFPCFEAVLGTEYLLHDCVVAVRDASGRTHRFVVSCQVGENLPLNQAFLGAQWRGSLVVLKCGTNVPYVGIRTSQDKGLAYQAAEKWASSHRVKSKLTSVSTDSSELHRAILLDLWHKSGWVIPRRSSSRRASLTFSITQCFLVRIRRVLVIHLVLETFSITQCILRIQRVLVMTTIE